MLTRVAEDRLAYVPQMEPIRHDLLLDALKFYQKFLEKQSDSRAIRQEAALAYRRAGFIHHPLGQSTQAEEAYLKAIAIMEELYASSSLEPVFRRHLARTHIEFSWLKPGGGLPGVRRAVQVAEKLAEDFPNARASCHRGQCTQHTRFSFELRSLDEAEKILRRNLLLVDDAYNSEGIYRGLSYLFQQKRHWAEAEEASRKALEYAGRMAAEAPAANWVQNNLAGDLRLLASVLAADQRPAEAEEYQRRAIVIYEKLAIDFPA
ncbi:MAG: hypothetical protein WKF75_21020, partial [Singulisphaera sp.]